MKKILIFLTLILLCTQPVFSKTRIHPEGGYVGSLPDVTERFKKTDTQEAAPIFDSVDGFNNQNQLKPVPRNNPAFVNIIIKKDKTSQYVNDINSVIPIIDKIDKCIEDKENIQKFNAAAYYLKENVEFIRDKYQNKSESSYISFKKLMQLNMHVQAVVQLRTEKEAYSPYLAYSGSGYIYNSNNVNQQLEYLQKEIAETLMILKQVN